MSANYYSQTPNFVSASSEDVDPRTRLFNFQHSFGQLIGNNAMGPELAFDISYSPTTATDYYDLGIGIAPALAIYDNTTGQLSLASGESYRVDATVNPPVVQQNKMRTFDFSRISNPDGSNGFRITEYDGSVTDLTEYDADIYVTTRIYTSMGYSLNVNWDFTSSWGWGIDSIVDDSGVTLLTFDHDAGPALTFYPGSSEEYTITLQKSNGYLSAVSHSGLPEGRWQYFYEDVGIGGGLLTLTKTQSITGLIKSVIYNNGTTDGLMQFPPQSGEAPLPAVTELTIDPGFDQPAMITTYTPDTPQGFPNYLGYDAPQGGQWDASTDYVYTLAGQDYFYSTVLTQTDSDGQEISTTYTYNNYHLLSKLEVLQGSAYYSAESWFYADAWQADNPNTSYDDLPPQYQYPLTQTLTWQDNSGTRNELTQYQYDDFGNLTQQIDPDGTQTDYEFYSAQGEANSSDGYTGCPADPNGFANLIKSKKVTPAPSDYNDVPIRVTYYRYSNFAALNNRPMTTAIVKVKESLVKLSGSSKQPLTTVDTQYNSADKSSFTYGQVDTKNTSIYNTTSKGTTSYKMTQKFTYTLTTGVLKTGMVMTTFDNLSLSGTVSHSCYSSKVSALTDFLGTKHTYYYDGAGRFSSLVTNEDNSAYKRTLDVDYTTTTDNAGNVTGLSTSFTENSNSVSRLNYDGLGRIISIEKAASEQIKMGYSTVLSRSYDPLGRVEYETITDSYLDTKGAVQSAPTHIKTRFDDWGRPCAHDLFSDSNNPSASIYLTRALQFDSVGNTYRKYAKSASGNVASNYTLVLNNLAVPESETQLTPSGSVYANKQSTYDGLKRLRQSIDQLGHTTVYGYDDFDRASKTTYADGTIVTQDYAPQFSLPIVQTVTVTDKSGTAYKVGTREIDGLGRVKNSTIGGRKESYTYKTNTADPTTFTDSLNRTFTYTYDPLLENAVTGISASYNGQKTEQTYTYFKNSGLLNTVTETGQQENAYTWFTSGEMSTETITNDLGIKKPSYTWSVMNQPVSYTDIAGNAQRISYFLSGKDVAKPETISDPAVNVSFTYDDFGRLQKQTAKAVSGSVSLITQISYDDYGREQVRTLTPNSGKAITITTGYYKNNQVANVKIVQGSTTLSDNKYQYDLRNRLQRHDCSGTSLPKDGYGQAFTSQSFEYDCLNNILTCTTVSSSGATDIATFKYTNSQDPTQLTSIEHKGNSAYPAVINLAYYADGRLKTDEAGRALMYDASGRLLSVKTADGAQAEYGYDGLNNLIFQSINSEEQYLYYRGSYLVNQVRQTQKQQDRFIAGLSGNAAVSHDTL
ncbi:RHS repeat domain-containing protein [Pseudescherichia vulneris]|uniref:RHS repeat domain-containing protein n=1 Tax=Pseudescherichia vulneris TaxID=566 RepID=UPI0030C97114